MQATIAKKRVSRDNHVKPQPRGKKLSANPKYIKPLQVLQRYRCLPSHYVSKLAGYAHTTLKNDGYPDLFHEEYVCMPPAAKETHRLLYRHRPMAITPKGERFMEWSGWGKPIERDTHQFKHVMMGELHRASCEIAAIDIPYLRLVTEREILRSPNCPPQARKLSQPSVFHLANGECIEPDDKVMGFYYAPPGKNPSSLFFTREDHRGTKDKKRLRDQVRKYLILDQEKTYQAQLGIRNCIHIWQTVNEYVYSELEDVILEETNGRGSSQICINLITDYTSFHNFPPATGWAVTENYRRVGFPVFNILEELKKKSE